MKEFIIKKDHHSSGARFRPHFGNPKYKINILFTESCLYEPLNRDYKDDLNKVGGFSHGFHHVDSARFAWKPQLDAKNKLTGKIELWSYIYDFGEREYMRLYTVSINTWHTLEIEEIQNKASNRYVFRIYSDMFPSMAFGIEVRKPPIKSGYYLFPWFGGNMPAQHDTRILMK